MVQREVGLDAGEHGGRQPDRRAVADDHDVAVEIVVVQVAQPQLGEHRQVAVQHLAAGFAAGQRHLELAAVPPLVVGVKPRDRLVVVAFFQPPDLPLVDAAQLDGRQRKLPADHRRGLRGPGGHRVREHGRPARPAGELAGLVAAQRRELGAGRPGVEAALDVSVRLAVPHQDQPAAHRRDSPGGSGLPSRTAASQRTASSVDGGSAPAGVPVGHEPR